MAGKSKTENKTVAEKVKAPLSPKRQLEADHLAGKHKAEGQPDMVAKATFNKDCGFCQRRLARNDKKTQAFKRFSAGQKK
jgi:hypothetical protein